MTKGQPEPPAPESTPQPGAAPNPFDGLVPGRIVWYLPTPAEQRQSGEPGPWPAMVTKVWEGLPGKVTINVNQPAATHFEDLICRKVVEHGDEPGRWKWMFEGQATRYKLERVSP